ncbi:MAG: hypothetical protein RIS52_1140 [Pseudomonadota bacterium]|jgi:hypothetical protein
MKKIILALAMMSVAAPAFAINYVPKARVGCTFKVIHGWVYWTCA